MEELAWVLGGEASYHILGLLLEASFKSSVVWNVIKERFDKRLDLWKM